MRKLYLLVAAGVVALVAAGSATAAPGTQVAFVVDTSFVPGTAAIVPGTSTVPGCDAATVTGTVSFKFVRQVGLFEGTKTVDCGASGTFTLAYKAHVIGCAPTDSGSWQIVDGTGMYDGMTGQGQVAGTYVGGQQCEATGILDTYTGTVRLATG